jgi:hypothetical protein
MLLPGPRHRGGPVVGVNAYQDRPHERVVDRWWGTAPTRSPPLRGGASARPSGAGARRSTGSASTRSAAGGRRRRPRQAAARRPLRHCGPNLVRRELRRQHRTVRQAPEAKAGGPLLDDLEPLIPSPVVVVAHLDRDVKAHRFPPWLDSEPGHRIIARPRLPPPRRGGIHRYVLFSSPSTLRDALGARCTRTSGTRFIARTLGEAPPPGASEPSGGGRGPRCPCARSRGPCTALNRTRAVRLAAGAPWRSMAPRRTSATWWRSQQRGGSCPRKRRTRAPPATTSGRTARMMATVAHGTARRPAARGSPLSAESGGCAWSGSETIAA